MRKLAEAGAFLGVAAAAHVALLAGVAPRAGLEGAGDGGAEPVLVSIEAAQGSLGQAVAARMTPPTAIAPTATEPPEAGSSADVTRPEADAQVAALLPLPAPPGPATAPAAPTAAEPPAALTSPPGLTAPAPMALPRPQDNADALAGLAGDDGPARPQLPVPPAHASHAPAPPAAPVPPEPLAEAPRLPAPAAIVPRGERAAPAARPSPEGGGAAPRIAAAPPAPLRQTTPAAPRAPAPPPPLARAEPLAPEESRRPAPRPAPAATTAAAPSAPSQAQRARGAAAGQAAGASGRAETATTDRSGSAQAMAVWGSQIRARVERARRHPGTGSGTAVVAFTLSREGALLAVQVAQSSGHAALDRAALEAVRRAAPFPPAPDGIRAAQSTFNLPVAFRR